MEKIDSNIGVLMNETERHELQPSATGDSEGCATSEEQKTPTGEDPEPTTGEETGSPIWKVPRSATREELRSTKREDMGSATGEDKGTLTREDKNSTIDGHLKINLPPDKVIDWPAISREHRRQMEEEDSKRSNRIERRQKMEKSWEFMIM